MRTSDQQQQQQIPVEMLVNIIGEQTIENRMLKAQAAQLSQTIQQMKEEKKGKDEPGE